MSTDIEHRLRSVLAAVLELDDGALGEDPSTDTVAAWDSLAHLNLVIAVEEEFGIAIPDEEVGEATSLALLRLVVGDQLARQAA